MKIVEIRLWLGGMSRNQIRAAMGRLTRPWPSARKPSMVRPGNFICDRHWAQIEASQASGDPISPTSVVAGLAIACHMSRLPEGKPVRHACCKINRVGWDGIIARSRPSWISRQSQPRSA